MAFEIQYSNRADSSKALLAASFQSPHLAAVNVYFGIFASDRLTPLRLVCLDVSRTACRWWLARVSLLMPL